MQPKHIIIAALVGIVALIVFNVLNSHSRPEAAPVQVESSSELAAQESTATVSTTETDAPSLGGQPKAILDNVHNNIDAAKAKEADKMAQVEGSL